MKRILAVTTIIVICITGLTKPTFSKEFIPANHPYIQYYGRWDRSNSTKATHSWPGVYIYAEFEGTSIGVRLFDNFTYFNVFVDGRLYPLFKGDVYGDANYTLVSGLADGPHTILFTKRCETTWTKFTFYGFILDDGKSLLPPPPRPERKIEFIGDSFTSASGNEYTEEGTPPETELVTNAYEGFGAIIARNYEADYTLSSCSGYGMVLDWTGDYNKNIPDCFDRTLLYTSSPKWDFSQWIPNLVVIGLGLNDYSGFEGWEGPVSEENTALYKSRYREFISTLRDLYPGVKILAVATHVEWMREHIAEVVAEENADGNRDVFYAQYSYYEGGYVNNGHPNVATHYGIADELIAAIDTINAWEFYVDERPPVFTKFPASPFTVTDTLCTIRLETDSYAMVRYDLADISYHEMAHEFTSTGKRKHSVTISCEHGRQYNYFLRAMDQNGNAMPSSAIISFNVDTLLAPIKWYHPTYPINAEKWKTGTAPLGRRFSDVVTEISLVNTAYFRHYFDLSDPSAVTDFSIDVFYDDGAAVFLNGAEICRLNISVEDTLRYTTNAAKAKEGMTSYSLDDKKLRLLKKNRNLIAVEIHQCTDEVGDMYFNGRLNSITAAGTEVIVDLGEEWDYFDLGQSPQEMSRDSIPVVVIDDFYRPSVMSLSQNYPNPFNPSTTICFSVPRYDRVIMEIFDSKGRLIETLIDEHLSAGDYNVQFHNDRYPSGIYFYRLKSGDNMKSHKMLLLK